MKKAIIVLIGISTILLSSCASFWSEMTTQSAYYPSSYTMEAMSTGSATLEDLPLEDQWDFVYYGLDREIQVSDLPEDADKRENLKMLTKAYASQGYDIRLADTITVDRSMVLISVGVPDRPERYEEKVYRITDKDDLERLISEAERIILEQPDTVVMAQWLEDMYESCGYSDAVESEVRSNMQDLGQRIINGRIRRNYGLEGNELAIAFAEAYSNEFQGGFLYNDCLRLLAEDSDTGSSTFII